MNDHHADQWEMEDLLRQVRVAEPSKTLDRRIRALFRPAWRRWIGPIVGFATGAAAASFALLSIMHPQPSLENRSHSANPIQSLPQSQPMNVYWTESREVRATADAQLNGVPVRIEQSKPRLVLWRETSDGKLWRADVDLPEQTIVRTVQRY